MTFYHGYERTCTDIYQEYQVSSLVCNFQIWEESIIDQTFIKLVLSPLQNSIIVDIAGETNIKLIILFLMCSFTNNYILNKGLLPCRLPVKITLKFTIHHNITSTSVLYTSRSVPMLTDSWNVCKYKSIKFLVFPLRYKNTITRKRFQYTLMTLSFSFCIGTGHINTTFDIWFIKNLGKYYCHWPHWKVFSNTLLRISLLFFIIYTFYTAFRLLQMKLKPCWVLRETFGSVATTRVLCKWFRLCEMRKNDSCH